MQYSIRLRSETDMSWGEFTTLLAGLGSETPLGKIVAIRSEKDFKIINKFTREQRRIYNEWKKRCMQKLKEDPVRYKAWIEGLQEQCRRMCGKGVIK